ncbi:MAG: radical SAM protein [archaeon]
MVHFERAIFISWYCGKGDCSFCYMSTQKKLITDPKKARRSPASIMAEAIICRELGWKIEFLSGGYESYSDDELVNLVKKIKEAYGKRLWLNLGALPADLLTRLRPYTKGVCGAVECINPEIRSKVCPSKPLKDIRQTFKSCDELGLKKSITIIIGLGETIRDFPRLRKFIENNSISKITFYALNPHKGTPFKKGPDTGYYAQWIEKTRNAFPKLEIVAGSWVNRLNEISTLLNAGADSITKFPAIRLFGTKYACQIEAEVKKANRKFKGSLTVLPKFDTSKYETAVKNKLDSYLRRMHK